MSIGVIEPSARPTGFVRRCLFWLASIVVPAGLSLLIVRYVWPSRLAGARGGVMGVLGWAGERHPLFVSVGVFVLLAEMGRYWWRHITRSFEDANAFERQRPARKSSIVAGLAFVAVAAFVVRASVVATYRVVGPSMLPTLEMNDRVVVNRLAYGIKPPFGRHASAMKTPARGDLVVFSAHGLLGNDGPESIVKRVIGIPGDRVGFDRGNIVVNDVPIPACDAGPYVNVLGTITVRGRLVVEFLGDAAYLTVRKAIESEFPTHTVEPGEVFVIGDNRGMSTDSRLWSEGHGTGVPIDVLDGKVERVLVGARPDGRLDFSRLLAPPLGLEVRMPGIDMKVTRARIAKCVELHRAMTLPDPTGRAHSMSLP